ncbi:MAG TPA: hypothetical protein VFV09_08680 [Actinomycetota bacterium]|jgi:hypothetical protein|nr:hypothetical protein [Actinomycetota bacterium]
MQPRKTIGLTALSLLFLLSIATPAYAAAGAGSDGTEPPAAPTAQSEPGDTVDTGLLAGATWVLLLPLVLLARLKISEARRIAWWNARPGLKAGQIADYLEDYRLDPDAPFPR